LDKRSRAARKASLSQIVVGIQKHFASTRKLIVASKEYTPEQLAQVFQNELDTIAAIETLEAQRKKARLVERRTYNGNRLMHFAFERIVRGAFSDARVLADFGYKSETKGKRTVEAKVAALAKAKATREARHTMGKKQRKKVRG
jgi:hypothetical protein